MFIELTEAFTDGKKVLVHVDAILSVRPGDGGAVLDLRTDAAAKWRDGTSDETYVVVTESYERVLDILTSAPTGQVFVEAE